MPKYLFVSLRITPATHISDLKQLVNVNLRIFVKWKLSGVSSRDESVL